MGRARTCWVLAGVVALAHLPAAAFSQGTPWEKQIEAAAKALQQGRYNEAEQLSRSALNEAARFGPQDPRLALNLLILGSVYRAQGRYAVAEPLHRRALAIGEKALGPEHPYVATSLENLGRLYRAQGKDAEAERLEARAKAIRAKQAGGGPAN